jgi:hypothetical protein
MLQNRKAEKSSDEFKAATAAKIAGETEREKLKKKLSEKKKQKKKKKKKKKDVCVYKCICGALSGNDGSALVGCDTCFAWCHQDCDPRYSSSSGACASALPPFPARDYKCMMCT